MLKSNGLNPTQAHGGYFILADTSAVKDTVIKSSSSSSSSDHQADDKSRGFDVQVCKYLTREAGVTAIPPSAFYDPAEREAESIANNGSCISDSLARFAFCKNQAMLDAAGEQLKAWKLKTTNL